jgi:hypothetical protein
LDDQGGVSKKISEQEAQPRPGHPTGRRRVGSRAPEEYVLAGTAKRLTPELRTSDIGFDILYCLLLAVLPVISSPPLHLLGGRFVGMLWRDLRAWQVYGANTDVGKTIVSTIICRALQRPASPPNGLLYLKPVSTGPQAEADDR